MKEEFVIDEIVTKESLKTPGLRVVLVPKKEVYSKNIKLSFSGDNCMQVLENWGIPSRTGDIVTVEVKIKNVQTEIGEK